MVEQQEMTEAAQGDAPLLGYRSRMVEERRESGLYYGLACLVFAAALPAFTAFLACVLVGPRAGAGVWALGAASAVVTVGIVYGGCRLLRRARQLVEREGLG